MKNTKAGCGKHWRCFEQSSRLPVCRGDALPGKDADERPDDVHSVVHVCLDVLADLVFLLGGRIWGLGKGKGDSNSHDARPVHLIITMIKWIRTSRLSLKNSLLWSQGRNTDLADEDDGSGGGKVLEARREAL